MALEIVARGGMAHAATRLWLAGGMAKQFIRGDIPRRMPESARARLRQNIPKNNLGSAAMAASRLVSLCDEASAKVPEPA